MEILLANPRGFCAGVERAIAIVERALAKFGAPIYVRHEVVHNKYVCDDLRAKGAIFIDELQDVPTGNTVIFSAHGVSKAVREEAEERGLKVFDASSPLVTKVHVEVGKMHTQGRAVVMIGHKGHPEVEGTMGQVQGGMHLVERVEGLGIRHPADYWYSAGVPVLGLQILFSLLAGAVFLLLEPRLGSFKQSRLDFFIFIAIWVLAAWFWCREPLSPNYFMPDTADNIIYPYSDGATFDAGAQTALIGLGLFNGWYFERVLYSVFLAYLHIFFGQNYEILMTIQAVIFAIFPAVIYLIGRELHSRALGVSAGILLAIRGVNAIIAAKWIDTASPKMLLTDFPTAIGIAIFLLLFVKWIKEPSKIGYLFWVGAVFGLTLMVRSHILTLLPVVLVCMPLFMKLHWRQIVLAGLLFLLGIFTVTLPWEIRNQSRGIPMYSAYYSRIVTILRYRYNIGVDAYIPHTQNLIMEGDNLQVLKLLQKGYQGKVKMIYIDPPYNTGNDFVYEDDFTEPLEEYLRRTGQVDEEGKPLTTNTRADGRFHSKWLSMMYPRLRLARQLLRDDGVIFVSIDDKEVVNLRRVMDDVFGEECRVAELVWKNKYNAGALTKGFSSVHEYLLCYSRSEIINLTQPLNEEDIAQYKGRDAKFATRGGYVTQPLSTSSKDPRPNLVYPITIGGREIMPEKQWIWERSKIEAAIANDEVVVNETDGKVSVSVKQYLKDENGDMREKKPLSLLVGPFNQEGTKETDAILGYGVFTFPKPSALISQLFSLTVNDTKDKGGIHLDFFGGSKS